MRISQISKTKQFSIAVPSMISILRSRAHQHGDRTAFTMLAQPGDEGQSITYAELDFAARRIGGYLSKVVDPGEPVLLFIPPSLEYIAAFLGCLYARVVAVPLYPPRINEKPARIINVIRDCGAKHALGLVANAEKIRKDLTQFSDQSIDTEFIIHRIETIDDVHVEDWSEPEINADTLAFLQYTSGSTGTPKGVMISHGNLIANQEAIAAATLTCETDLAVSWLPPYHDMGLIGTILHPLYRGFPAVLMPPMSFIQDPLSWLETMSRFRATLSGGPNFAYALCGQKATDDRLSKLNLSSWRVAFNGAEPIRPDTLTAFAERFAPCGFDPGAFFPCYGLAEATLFVSGAFLNKDAQIQYISKKRLEQGQVVQEALGNTSQALVSCGQIAATHSVRIVSPEGIAVAANQVGEIWIAGPSV
ncbi:MAG TPA: hypothetical protein DEV81_21675, partial [Cyanobacteria bacterium UBA11049]|nr:hypothetical protein [Cyanobacteria bacterium UBA11049]